MCIIAESTHTILDEEKVVSHILLKMLGLREKTADLIIGDRIRFKQIES